MKIAVNNGHVRDTASCSKANAHTSFKMKHIAEIYGYWGMFRNTPPIHRLNLGNPRDKEKSVIVGYKKRN
jgi:hypothetical protein